MIRCLHVTNSGFIESEFKRFSRLSKARLREGSEFNCAGTKKAGLLGEQRREGARVGFPELEPREAGFPNSSRVQV